MKKSCFVLIGILCTINVFARVPSVSEASNHLSGANAVRYADNLQAEASLSGLYDRYFVKLTEIPSAAVPVYDDHKDILDSDIIKKVCEGDKLLFGFNHYTSFCMIENDFNREKNSYHYDQFFKYGGFRQLVRFYVHAHTTLYNELTCYAYKFKYTIYVTKGSTGQTSAYTTYSEEIYYNPYDGSWDDQPFDNKKREESMERTKEYIMKLYSAKEFMTILGITDGFKRIIANKKYRDTKEQEILSVLCQGLTGSGPILPHNSAIEDKYNKAMFGDISAQIKNLPSSSIKPAVYKGGEQAFASYLRNNIKYPEALSKDGYDESCVYTLTIGADGSVKRVRSDCNDLNELVKYQTVQLLMNLPDKFTPANGYGQNVESEYTVSMNYHIDPILTIDEPSLYFQSEGGEKVVRVTTKKEWTFSTPKQSGVKARKDGNRLIITCDKRKKQNYNPLNDKVFVSVVGTDYKYEVSIRQDGAPKPYISPSQTKVNLSSKKGAREVVTVDSNREWKVIHHNPETKIDAHKVDNRIIFTAPKNNKRYGKDATITLKSLDNDCQTNIFVHQYSKKEEKENSLDSHGRERSSGSSKSSSSSGLGLWYNYYENYGSFELGLLSVQAGAGCTLPLFVDVAGERTLVTQPYFPMNFELGTLRFHFIELSLLNLRLDLSLDGLDGIAWEPQVRGLIPVSERWALMPYVGPVWQIDRQQIENSVWSASGGLIARVRYGHATHTDLSIGYRGGPYGGLAFSVSIGWSLGW